MTADEANDLSLFLEQLVRVRGVRKEPEADALIQRASEQQPDTGYLLVQRVLLLERALDQAKARLAAAEAELKAGKGSDAPRKDEVGALAQGLTPPGTASPMLSAPVNARVIPQAAPASAGGSWLSQMASTAAGVAAGAFLFQGIQSLLSRASAAGGYAGAPGPNVVEETTIDRFHQRNVEPLTLADASDDVDDGSLAAPDDDWFDAGFGDDSDII